MTLREAAEMALEALVWESEGWEVTPKITADAIDALRAALTEPEAEPVAWMESPYGAIRANPLYKISAPQSVEWSIPLYAALAEPDEVVAEREACAKLCIEVGARQGWHEASFDMADACAAAIRARGER